MSLPKAFVSSSSKCCFFSMKTPPCVSSICAIRFGPKIGPLASVISIAWFGENGNTKSGESGNIKTKGHSQQVPNKSTIYKIRTGNIKLPKCLQGSWPSWYTCSRDHYMLSSSSIIQKLIIVAHYFTIITKIMFLKHDFICVSYAQCVVICVSHAQCVVIDY